MQKLPCYHCMHRCNPNKYIPSCRAPSLQQRLQSPHVVRLSAHCQLEKHVWSQTLTCVVLSRPCFQRWWMWQQAVAAGRAAAICQEQGQGAERAIAAAGLIPDDAGCFMLACPSCRMPLSPATLRHALPPQNAASTQAARPKRSPTRGTGDGRSAAGGDVSKTEVAGGFQLPADQMAALRAQQAARAAAFDRQRQLVRSLAS